MADTSNFFNLTRAKVKNQKPGYRNRAWLAVASWMTLIAEPASGSTVFGKERKTVVDDHTFSTGKGFIEVYCLPKTVEGDGDSVGDVGAMHMNWTPKFWIPGDSAELQTMIEDGLLNDDLVLLVEDANCPDGGVRQFGCECTPLNMTKSTFTSGNTGDGKKGWAIESATSCRFFYEGTITAMP